MFDCSQEQEDQRKVGLELGLVGLEVAKLFVLFHSWQNRLEIFMWKSYALMAFLRAKPMSLSELGYLFVGITFPLYESTNFLPSPLIHSQQLNLLH